MTEQLTPLAQVFLKTKPSEIKPLYETPTCTELERNFKRLLLGEFPNFKEYLLWIEVKTGHKPLEFYQGPVWGLPKWTCGSPPDVYQTGLVKNPSNTIVGHSAIGPRNAIVEVNGIFFAALADFGGFEVTRPIRVPYNEELKQPFHALLAEVTQPLPLVESLKPYFPY